MKIYRHGDVLIREIKAIPVTAEEEKKDKAVTVALGEATGHHHTLYGGMPISLLIDGDRRFLDVPEEVSLRHQEHDELRIAKGSYEITMEREFDYFENAMKRVVD